MRTARFQRRDRAPGRTIRSTGLVRLGGEWLPPREAKFLTEYLKHFNGVRAAKAIGVTNSMSGFTSSTILKSERVRSALRGALEERRDAVDVKVDEVARYWYDVATADPRELSQHVYVPCRCCWGVDHQYQHTDGELRTRHQEHRAAQLKLPEEDRCPLDELGGAGYTINRYPMRGPDWETRMERMYAEIRAPLPEGLEANSDHSCPECHGDGERRVWFADTRHLSAAAVRLYNGVRVTREAVEIKMMDRIDAMEKFEQLTGMVRPRRVKFGFNLDELSVDELDELLDEARTRGLLSDDEIVQGRLIDASPSPSPAAALTTEDEK